MGPRDSAVPTNSLMPAWDIERWAASRSSGCSRRCATATHRRGPAREIALSDVAFATVGNLGRIAEVQLEGRDQPRDGNYLYGAFGGDFPTADGRRVMVVALTSRQWKALKEVTGTEELFATVEQATGHDFRGEAGRYKGRDLIRELLTPWFAARALERDPRGVRRHRRVVGAVPDVQAARRRGSALLDGQPDVHRGRASGRHVPHAGVAAGVLAQRPAAGAAVAAAGRAHRRDPRRARAGRRGGRRDEKRRRCGGPTPFGQCAARARWSMRSAAWIPTLVSDPPHVPGRRPTAWGMPCVTGGSRDGATCTRRPAGGASPGRFDGAAYVSSRSACA